MKTMQDAKPRRTRTVTWGICPWCVKRGMDPPMRMGKRKCLERHMVTCEANFRLEQEVDSKDVDVSKRTLLKMMQHLTQKVAALKGDIVALQQKRTPYKKVREWWEGLEPSKCWEMRKKNSEMLFGAIFAEFEMSSQKYTKREWFKILYDPEAFTVAAILITALWPVLIVVDDKLQLKSKCSTDSYHIWKKIWGKKGIDTDLSWFADVMKPFGVDFTPGQMANLSNKFDWAYNRFSSTVKRSGGGVAPQGLVAMTRIWRQMVPEYKGQEEFMKACMLTPQSDADSESEIRSLCDPPSSGSIEARAGNSSAMHLSSTDTPLDYVEVQFSS